MGQFITLQDVFLTPFYLLFFYALLYFFKTSIKDKQMRDFFIVGFSVKIVGAIFFGLVFQFFYGYGDTFFYFKGMGIARRVFLQSPMLYLKIIFGSATELNPETAAYVAGMPYFGDPSSFAVERIGSVFSILSFHTYIVDSLFFALLSFMGSWQMYRAWADVYPVLKRQLGQMIFFIPSVFFWSSGILKDSITYAALCFAFAAFHFGVIRRQNLLYNLTIFFVACYTLYVIKLYILLCFIPAYGWWFYTQYNRQIKSELLRLLLAPVLLALGFGVGFYTFQNLIQGTEYDLNKVAERAFITADWIKQVSSEGSYYDIGLTKGSTIGDMALLMPKAIFIALFRPFLWEARNPVMLLAGLENILLLFLTFQVFRKQKLGTIITRLKTQPMIVFCLIFIFFFAGIVGLTSSNFGTLVRYRIPVLPFYMIALVILAYNPPKIKKRPNLRR